MNDIAVRTQESVVPSAFAMRPRTLDEAMKFAEIMANSDLVPAGYKGKPGNILVACQMGHELGMTPMRALRSIVVINGRATMWGDDLLAMVLASPLCEYVDESESDEKEGICKVKRKGSPEHLSRFTLEDAKRACLLGKPGPWQQHTGRMLKLRARGFALRDKFADVLAGLVTAEEAMDLSQETPRQPVESVGSQTLKDRLRVQVEKASDLVTQGAAEVGESSVCESAVREPTPGSPTADAPSNEPPELAQYWSRIRTSKDEAEAKKRYEAVPDAIRQDCWTVYSETLRKLGRKK